MENVLGAEGDRLDVRVSSDVLESVGVLERPGSIDDVIVEERLVERDKVSE